MPSSYSSSSAANRKQKSSHAEALRRKAQSQNQTALTPCQQSRFIKAGSLGQALCNCTDSNSKDYNLHTLQLQSTRVLKASARDLQGTVTSKIGTSGNPFSSVRVAQIQRRPGILRSQLRTKTGSLLQERRPSCASSAQVY